MTEDKEHADRAEEKIEYSPNKLEKKKDPLPNTIVPEENAETNQFVNTLRDERGHEDIGDEDDDIDEDEGKLSDKEESETNGVFKEGTDNVENKTDDEENKDESGAEESENNDEPTLVEGKRKRIQVERLSFSSPIANSPSRAPIIGYGTGKPLGSFPHIENNINKIHSLQLKLLHRLLYTYTSKMNLIKREIRLFNGFPFNSLSKEYQKKVDFLNKLNQADLKVMKQVLGMKCRVKKDLIEELLSFLSEPDDKKFQVTKKRHTTPKSVSEPKAKKPKISTKDSVSDNSSSDDSTDEEYEKREDVVQKFKKRARENKDLSASPVKPEAGKTKTMQKLKPAQIKEVLKPGGLKKKSVEKKNDSGKNESAQKPEAGKGRISVKTEASKEKVSEITEQKAQENVVAKDRPSKKKKNVCSDSNPTDEMIVNMIRELLKGADLTMISMRQMINTLHECFPNASFEGRKAFLKEKVINVVQE